MDQQHFDAADATLAGDDIESYTFILSQRRADAGDAVVPDVGAEEILPFAPLLIKRGGEPCFELALTEAGLQQFLERLVAFLLALTRAEDAVGIESLIGQPPQVAGQREGVGIAVELPRQVEGLHPYRQTVHKEADVVGGARAEDLPQVGVGGEQLVLGGAGGEIGELGCQRVSLIGLDGERVAPDAVGRVEQMAVVAGHAVDGLLAHVEQAATPLCQVIVLVDQRVELARGDVELLHRLRLLQEQVADQGRAVGALDLGFGYGLFDGLDALPITDVLLIRIPERIR